MPMPPGHVSGPGPQTWLSSGLPTARSCAEVVGVGGELLDTVCPDQEVVLDAEPAAALPVRAGLDRQDHPLLDRSAACLVGVRRLVGAGPDAVRDRMRRLSEARFGDSGA